ncbi:MAG: helix-turn-helix domain-containing protein [Betaproteobacteria bacterium]
MLAKRIRLCKGEALFRVGDAFVALYAVRSGSCKTVLLSQAGQDQVAGYHMAGEIIGTDGIGARIHDCQATALEEMEVCPLPFDQIENLARGSDPLRRNLHQVLSQESARARALMLVLGTMRAEQRLGVFLLDLSQQYRAHGYSSTEFVMRLTRDEIGSYLGLKLETVSRLFSRFQHEGLILVQGRAVKMLDRAGVRRLVAGDGLRECVAGDKSVDRFAVKQSCKGDGTPIIVDACTLPR